MASKTASKSVSKSGSSNSNATKNVAAGGQVYDRTTGTWEGATKGSFGDGIDRGAGLVTKVHRDAEGITGVEQLNRREYSKRITTGPGSDGAVVGGAAVRRTTGPGTGFVGLASSMGPSSAAVVTGPLKPVLDDEVTSLMIGGDWYKSNPWFSDVGKAWSDRLGEPGEWLGALVTIPADLIYTGGFWTGEAAKAAPSWNGATPSQFNEAQPVYHDGWVSYDEGGTWEKAPSNSPANEARNWSF